MPEDTNIPTVDMSAIEAEIAALSPEAMADALIKTRVRQKTQQKKQYAKGTMKAYQLKQRERFKQMKEKALLAPATLVDPTTSKPYLNLWAQINALAEKQAEKNLEESADVPGEDDNDETTA